MIGAAHRLGELVHYGLHDPRTSLVERVRPLAHLKKHIGILRRAAQNRMIGRQRTLTMLEDAIHINERAHVVLAEHFNFVYFMRSAEAVEEMHKRNT